MNSFRCENLFKSFEGIHAIDGITLEFPDSCIIGIIGPNGAGKTTLINVLTGFLRPNAGRCFLRKRETTHLPPHRIVQLGVARTFQDLRLITQVTVIDNVLLARPKQRGERLLPALLHFGFRKEEARNREEAMRLLQFVGLEDKAHELVSELSYGQQKLLTLACCLASEAQILLLDEPVAGVAPERAALILELLKKLRASGMSIVFIEHAIEAVRLIADIVVVMDEGRIIAQGPTHEVLQRAEIMEVYLG